MKKINYFEFKKSNNIVQQLSWCDLGGNGKPVLLLNGFLGTFASWQPLIDGLGTGRHYYILDLKGDSNIFVQDQEVLSPYDHAQIIRNFIRTKKLYNLTIIAHSIGATAAAIAAADIFVKQRVDELILLSPLGLERALPEKLTILTGNSPKFNPLMRDVDSDLIAYLLLSLFVDKPENISDEDVGYFSKSLKSPELRKHLISTARKFFIPDQYDFITHLQKITAKTLVIWGKNDRISAPENANTFKKYLTNCIVKVIPNCGHLPQLEMPAIVADFIANFPENKEIPIRVTEPPINDKTSQYKLKLRRLFDRWTFGTAGFLLFLKFLQFLRKCGIKAEENGWRKATGIFMRNEYSKFILSCFRLKYYRSVIPPINIDQAKQELIDRLRLFLQSQSSFHWTAEPGFLIIGRRNTFFCDIVVANYTPDGRLESLEPYFDTAHDSFAILTPEQIDGALAEIVKTYNRLSAISGRNRARHMQLHMKKWSKNVSGYKYAGRTTLKMLVDRMMTASYLHCEVLPRNDEEANRLRLRTPHIRKHRHPGWGLLNIFCRFTPDFNEADLWVQFHHVPVDGSPMQELLDKLKHEWGSFGQITFPAINSRGARPEIFHCGDRLFRAKFYLDFQKMLALRSYLNSLYTEEMGGKVTIAGMMLWGLAMHPYFERRKMLFPVDVSGSSDSKERELSLVFIRPQKFKRGKTPLESFLQFQKHFNYMIDSARRGDGESLEFLNLSSLAPPILYHLTHIFLPTTLREIVGTMGVSIIRDAEMFISPLSDFQTAGFMAIGSMLMPSADGNKVGAVSVCATRKQVRYYISAMNEMSEKYYSYLGFNQQPTR